MGVDIWDHLIICLTKTTGEVPKHFGGIITDGLLKSSVVLVFLNPPQKSFISSYKLFSMGMVVNLCEQSILCITKIKSKTLKSFCGIVTDNIYQNTHEDAFYNPILFRWYKLVSQIF